MNLENLNKNNIILILLSILLSLSITFNIVKLFEKDSSKLQREIIKEELEILKLEEKNAILVDSLIVLNNEIILVQDTITNIKENILKLKKNLPKKDYEKIIANIDTMDNNNLIEFFSNRLNN